ncbi:MAG: hypothetical protein J7L31_06580, partial [Thermoplasmata archaeon]|nr:hypothetical protein [Thermoplasmata archaeon]
MAVGIAGMLIAMPYESNAVIGAIALGVIAGATAFGLGYYLGYISHKSDETKTIYYVNATTYTNQWKNIFETWDNIINTTLAGVNNTIDMVELQNNFWVRVAENNVLQYLNKTTWDSSIEENITKDFDDYMFNLTWVIIK